MTRFLIALFCLSLSACARDETLSAHGAAGQLWTLTEINGTPFDAPASLFLEPGGALQGVGPCNSFQGEVTSPYPWFNIDGLRRSNLECDTHELEHYFLQVLLRMTESEVLDKTLILRDSTGVNMVFTTAEPEPQEIADVPPVQAGYPDLEPSDAQENTL